jgi:outer membrane protein OmpA-like peptidoglycan-associated protein
MTERAARLARAAAIALLPAWLAGCAPGATVVLLPDADGRKTAVAVKQGGKETVLDEPYAAARQHASGTDVYRSSPQEVSTRFAPALDAQPARKTTFTLYFIEAKEEFTDESKLIVDGVFTEISKRPVPDIVVVGHADATGTDQFNDSLAQRRADVVKAELIRRGIPAASIDAISRGRREPAVPKPSGVAEARNRRVEIVVR